MKESFLARGFSEIVKVVFGRDQSVKKNLENGIPYVTTYDSKVKDF